MGTILLALAPLLYLGLNEAIVIYEARRDPRPPQKQLLLYAFFGVPVYLWRGVGPWLMLPPRILWMIAKGMRRGYLLPAKGEKKF